MAITAAQVKELRERTGAGMMECKKALTETDGDMDTAVEALRKSGIAKADKKASRVAAEGVIVIKQADDGKRITMVEINSETDFASKRDEFIDFSNKVARCALNNQPADIDALMSMPVEKDGITVNETRQALVATIGEKIDVRRFINMETSDGQFGCYLHGIRIGVVVEMQGGDEVLYKDIAMHIAATNPICVSADDVPADLLEKEKDIFKAQAEQSGKPPEIIEKMIGGRIKKYLKEITLSGQPFVKDPDMTVEKLLKNANASVVRFVRMEVGEGIEKKSENFAEEVMAQVSGN